MEPSLDFASFPKMNMILLFPRFISKQVYSRPYVYNAFTMFILPFQVGVTINRNATPYRY